MSSTCWARKRPLFATEVLCRSFYFSFIYVSTVFLLGTDVYFNRVFFINYSRYLKYELNRNEKDVDLKPVLQNAHQIRGKNVKDLF